jgi:DUF2075 family protein
MTLAEHVRHTTGQRPSPSEIKSWRRSLPTLGDAPPSMLWASDPNGFGQVGCVYTAQGFEYDCAG